jgi:GNAT superfamily N-acetyltransferase
MKTTISIKTASPADADTLAKLNQHVHKLHLETVSHFFKQPASQEVVAFFREHLAKANWRAFIAYIDDTAVGYLLVTTGERPENTFSLARRWLYIDQISVEPDWQGQGVGRELMNVALQYARQVGLDNIEVDTWAFNNAAQSFFQSIGFQPKTRRFWLRLEDNQSMD